MALPYNFRLNTITSLNDMALSLYEATRLMDDENLDGQEMLKRVEGRLENLEQQCATLINPKKYFGLEVSEYFEFYKEIIKGIKEGDYHYNREFWDSLHKKINPLRDESKRLQTLGMGTRNIPSKIPI